MQSSTIFITQNGEVKPRQDATVRILLLEFDSSQSAYIGTKSINVELLEFHPFVDPTGNGRACAFIKPVPELLQPDRAIYYKLRGAGFLEEPYIGMHEHDIHPDDFQELMHWSWNHLDPPHGALIIHPCPIPCPVFKKGDRVVVESNDPRWKQNFLGQKGTITKGNSIRMGMRGAAAVDFDDPEYHTGFDGSTSVPAVGILITCLRKLEPGEEP